MFDSAILPVQHRLLDPPARWLAAQGVRADTLTLAGFGFGIVAFGLLALGLPSAALAAIALNRLADGLDGAVARATRTTDRGAFADIAFDFLFYALVPLGFAIAGPATNALPAAVLIAAFVGTGSSFLAFAVIAAQQRLSSDRYPSKGIFYLGGLTEGTETIAVFIAMCLWPAWFPALAYGFALACAVTAIARLRAGWVAFSSR
jgi:phosphatidylglycerophosphate synthase